MDSSSKTTENYWLVVSGKQDSGTEQGVLLQSHEQQFDEWRR